MRVSCGLVLLLVTACTGSPRSAATLNNASAPTDLQVDAAHIRTGPPWCRPDTGDEAVMLLWKAQQTGTRAERRAAAHGWTRDHLPHPIAGGASFVREDDICERASQVLDATFPELAPRHEAVTVLRRRRGYWVASSLRFGEFTAVVPLDAAFRWQRQVHLW